ncbi:hypothetical protein CONCODRAFT_4952 [Conidiobolus coronatus NRRL 28638]|uniref:G-protein coupled receptors family 1 profile domain-containing protein n=1 Tax=Conidiobolus coronatus (strain ATCC 28846 / CBS 209.66 / NRRL 28638) TaxID=796925 RepID=A0A137PB10_CONC2|nr:hypothetical protein CONCODRAFT_4952 [Conidiobolus coronatus NRRL 28638]|eukprot:KXN72207.1 hypothetical protein CONCODRAFT_4952 [Conidiobolus coronatus NRRL 28638]
MNYYKIRELAYPCNYVVSIVGIFLSIFGTIISTLVVHVILKNKWKILSIDLKLICFTLIFDILHCFLAFTSGICDIIGFGDYLNSRFTCSLNSVLTIFTAITSINLVGVVALERYLLIIKAKTLNSIVYYKLILGLQLINLANGVVSGTFGGFSISSASVYCMFNLNSWAGIVGSTVLSLSTGTSIFMIYFCYISIMIKRRSSALEIQKLFPLKARKIRNEANSTILKSTLIIIASTFTTIPYCAVMFIKLFNPSFLTPLVAAICLISAMFNMVFNPIIVLRLRIDIWDEIKVLFFIKSDGSDIISNNVDDYQLTILKEGDSEVNTVSV